MPQECYCVCYRQLLNFATECAGCWLRKASSLHPATCSSLHPALPHMHKHTRVDLSLQHLHEIASAPPSPSYPHLIVLGPVDSRAIVMKTNALSVSVRHDWHREVQAFSS
ncbi:hypothetical protein CC86DRAFT_79896 [Ophiobolus disseminans]|uniref:Uncharacterized protein n=1 Tax=Ophiobolus disseminans TaxID=1469910 RepID=A0A6A6ZQ30_9PLEO|nr:hypothetical protein CC86DRAFT_79896 [Ophiobolus disseminans]